MMVKSCLVWEHLMSNITYVNVVIGLNFKIIFEMFSCYSRITSSAAHPDVSTSKCVMKNKSYKSHRTIKCWLSKAFIFFALFRFSCVHPATVVTRHRDFRGSKFLIKLFLGEMNGGLNRIIKLHQLCGTLLSAARWKAERFHAPSKPLTRHEKAMTSILAKTQGRNEWYHCGH